MEKHKSALYKRIKAEIIALIKEENMQPGTRLPSEGELASKYNISKMTSKLALNSLEKDGVIYRIERSGSYIADKDNKPQNDKDVNISISIKGFIGLILPNSDFYTIDIMHNLEQLFSKKNYQLIIRITDNDISKEEAALKELSSSPEVNGIVLFPNRRRFCGDTLVKFQLDKYPIVLIDTTFRELSLDSVCHNHYNGAYEITSYLIQKGHKKIGFLSHNLDDSYSREQRYKGYLDAMMEQNLFVEKRYIYMLDSVDKRKLYQLYFKENSDLTAIFCSEDYLASQLLYALNDIGVKVPKDVSIVGFTDNKLLSFLPIGITTVRQPTKLLAIEVVKLLLSRIKNRSHDAKIIIIDTEIIERQSIKLV